MRNSPIPLAIAVVFAASACGDGHRDPVTPPPAQPDTPAGEWMAATLNGEVLPGVIEVYDPDETYGYPASVHMVVDSAKLVLTGSGEYRHRIWVSEWEGDVGGPPRTLRNRWGLGDNGGWSRAGDAMRLDSWYLENLVMEGDYRAPGTLRLNHGLTHGSPAAPFTYVRRGDPVS